MTGGSGFIGLHFHQKYDQTQIINYDILPPLVKNQATYIQGNILDFEKVMQAMRGCETIIHLAATHADFHKNYFTTNRDGTEVLLRAARRNKVQKLVFYSSVAVYGTESNGATEAQQPKPNAEYGASKLAAEHLIRAWVSENPAHSALIIRPTVVFGPYNFANVFNLIKQIDSGFYVNIGKGENIKSIAYVENLVLDTLKLLDDLKPGIYTYNYISSPQLTSHQIARVIAQNLGKKVMLTLQLSLAKLLILPLDLTAKLTGKNFPISRARLEKFCVQTYFIPENLTKLGFEQAYTTQEGLEKTVQWYKETDWKAMLREWQWRIHEYA